MAWNVHHFPRVGELLSFVIVAVRGDREPLSSGRMVARRFPRFAGTASPFPEQAVISSNQPPFPESLQESIFPRALLLALAARRALRPEFAGGHLAVLVLVEFGQPFGSGLQLG